MSGLEKSLWISQRIIGVVFLVAGLTKIWDPVLFFWEAVMPAQRFAHRCGDDGFFYSGYHSDMATGNGGELWVFWHSNRSITG